jgi:hypothetical protein
VRAGVEPNVVRFADVLRFSRGGDWGECAISEQEIGNL